MKGEVIQFDRNGLKVASFQLDYAETDFDRTTAVSPWPVIHARPRDTYIGLGATLFRISESGQQQSLQFPSPITGISGTQLHTRERLLVTHETGAYLLSPTVDSFGETMIEEHSAGLLGCILGDHRAVLWRPGVGGAGDLLLYSFLQDRVVFQGSTPRIPSGSQAPDQGGPGVLKLLPTAVPNQVAIIPNGANGSIELWSFPP